MSGKFMNLEKIRAAGKHIVTKGIPMLTAIMIISQLTGCSGMTQDETASLIHSEPTIEVEFPTLIDGTEEESDTDVKSEVSPLRWIYLGRQTSYPNVRVAVNSACGIESGVGSIYINLDGEHEVNNTLYNALRNKGFIEAFYSEDNEQLISASALDTFADVELDEALAAVINSYWDLLPEEDGEEATEFNGSQSLTRAQAMTLVMRAVTPVTEDGVPKANSRFTESVGETAYTDFAAAMNDKCYVNINDSSLTKDNFTKSMTRAEFIYMVMNEVYGVDAINAYDISKVELSDCKDGGDISTKQGYTNTNGSALSLEFMLSNPDGGLQTSLYKAVAMASDLSIISSETRWDEPVTKTEAIEILVDTIKTLNPATEETAGIDEAALREEGEHWYNEYKDRVTCDEETFITEYIQYRIGGMEEVDAANEVYLAYIKIVLQEPTTPAQTETVPSSGSAAEDIVYVNGDDTPNAITGNGDKTEDAKPTVVKPDKPAETTPAKDYSSIKWGDPIPDNIVRPSGKRAEVVKWKEAPGGKFVYINGGYYYSIQDWVDGKPGLSMEVVDGKTVEQAIEDGDISAFENWH